MTGWQICVSNTNNDIRGIRIYIGKEEGDLNVLNTHGNFVDCTIQPGVYDGFDSKSFIEQMRFYMGDNYPQSIWFEKEIEGAGEESGYLGKLAVDVDSDGWEVDYEFD